MTKHIKIIREEQGASLEQIQLLLKSYVGALAIAQRKSFKKLEGAISNMNNEIFIHLKSLEKVKEDFSKKVESLEEGLMYVLHNVKKNQYLYAHYPEDWVNDYLDIKKGIKSENEFMDKKIEALHHDNR